MLGVEPGATPDAIKAAWRGLARRHHPDLIGDDPGDCATRHAAHGRDQRRLCRADPGGRDAGGAATRAASRAANGAAGTAAACRHTGRTGGPPPPPKTPPVTGRLDLSGNVWPRNQTTSPPGSRIPLSGQPPLRWDRSSPELRASQPSGPMEIRRDPRYVPPVAPPLDDALVREVEFGKFHGHTLGEIAAFEPSYIDWLAGTVTRDPELALAARVIRDELDRRGIIRTTPTGPARLAVEPVPLTSPVQAGRGRRPAGRTCRCFDGRRTASRRPSLGPGLCARPAATLRTVRCWSKHLEWCVGPLAAVRPPRPELGARNTNVPPA